MEQNLKSIGQSLKERPIPHVDEIVGVFCVLVNEQWHRARRLTESGLSNGGPICVFCIDTGEVHYLPIASICTLINITGFGVELMRDCPGLARKYFLADVAAPAIAESSSLWSESAVSFFKLRIEKRSWIAAPVCTSAERQGVRLFDLENNLLATLIIQEGLGRASTEFNNGASSEAEETRLLPNTRLAPSSVLDPSEVQQEGNALPAQAGLPISLDPSVHDKPREAQQEGNALPAEAGLPISSDPSVHDKPREAQQGAVGSCIPLVSGGNEGSKKEVARFGQEWTKEELMQELEVKFKSMLMDVFAKK